MAHYAFLNENNIVTEVIAGKDENEDGIDWEQHYGNFRGQKCKRTSYNTLKGEHKTGGVPFRKNYAGIGYTYNAELDAFVPPKPYESWVLNNETACWESPVGSAPALTEEEVEARSFYRWDEQGGAWVLETPPAS